MTHGVAWRAGLTEHVIGTILWIGITLGLWLMILAGVVVMMAGGEVSWGVGVGLVVLSVALASHFVPGRPSDPMPTGDL